MRDLVAHPIPVEAPDVNAAIKAAKTSYDENYEERDEGDEVVTQFVLHGHPTQADLC
jgi:hypothetical protein